VSERNPSAVARHYNRLDRFYRRLWGEHVHHGFWETPTWSTAQAVRHLVHRVAEDARLTDSARVCDVGSGYGAPARLLAEDYGAHVTGFTVSAAQHAYAEAQPVDGPRPDYRLQDVRMNTVPDAWMDAVVLIESLSHIDGGADVLREAARMLRPGGRLVVCAWLSAEDPPGWARRWLLDPIREEGRLAALPAASTVEQWTRDAGFTIERFDDVTRQVQRTWSVVIGRVLRALATDRDVRHFLWDASEPDRVFARTVLRLWLAYRVGAMRYGWLVATR
jgi:tocopherol O-methyltransferase